VAFFALLRMHTLFDWLKTWEYHLATVPVPADAKDWGTISIPPPIDRSWKCRTLRQHSGDSVDKDDDGDASSDDDEIIELEPAAELEDAEFIGNLDRVMDDCDVSGAAL
jgi:hypothetical protein